MRVNDAVRHRSAPSGSCFDSKLSDIDSERRVVHVRGGKDRKDRHVMLSEQSLAALRQHWRALPRKPTEWLFPGGRWHTGDHPISVNVPWNACREASQRAAIDKPVHPHTLRHCFATHLLEAGADSRTMQLLLGRRGLEETARHPHLPARHLSAAASPLDRLQLTSSAEEDPGTKQMQRPPLEVAGLLRAAGECFLEKSRGWLRGQHRKVLSAIERCRCTPSSRCPTNSPG